ncbi:MAG: PqqD family protein [Prevotellaceae bacterium]|nr:PqqD family protein [Prevotellaceae bacterium]
MKIKNGFDLREVCGEHLIVAYGRENIDYNKVISLNESAAFLWRAVIGKDFTAQTLAELLVSEYDVDQETAARDAQTLLDEWTSAGLTEN